MDSARRKTLYNRCKPGEKLPIDDSRYVDLDAREVRGTNWVERLAAPLELSDAPICRLFTGLPGSGKSTELLRLAARLERREGANFMAVVIDALDTLDLEGPIDESTVLLVILDQCERALLEAEGHEDLDAAMDQGYFKRLWTWLSRTDIELSNAQFSVGDVGKLTAELKTRPSLRARFNATIGAHFNRFLTEVKGELTLMQARAEALGRVGLVVIFDSLEKLRGSGTTYEDVLVSAERVFASDSALRRLPIHTLFTIPPALVSRQRFAGVNFIPMIKLHKHPADGGGRYEPGYDAAMQLLLERVPHQDLAEVFGEQSEARIERLIEWSGGYPRELVRLLQRALGSSSFPLSDAAFNRLLAEVSDEYRKLITADAFPWLAQVAVERYLTHTTPKQRQTADVMLSQNVILRYLNERDWFDVHPSVREIPGVAAEIERLHGLADAEPSESS